MSAVRENRHHGRRLGVSFVYCTLTRSGVECWLTICSSSTPPTCFSKQPCVSSAPVGCPRCDRPDQTSHFLESIRSVNDLVVYSLASGLGMRTPEYNTQHKPLSKRFHSLPPWDAPHLQRLVHRTAAAATSLSRLTLASIHQTYFSITAYPNLHTPNQAPYMYAVPPSHHQFYGQMDPQAKTHTSQHVQLGMPYFIFYGLGLRWTPMLPFYPHSHPPRCVAANLRRRRRRHGQR